MDKIEVEPSKYLDQIYRILKNMGALLVSAKRDNSVNVMTIGWTLIGRLWEKDFALVAVRPSRHTFTFIEDSNDFTINIPTSDMSDTVNYCGTVSGRDEDKIKRKKLKLIKGRRVNSPLIEQCCWHYECRVAYKTQVKNRGLPQEIITTCYPQGDFHTMYLGEILNVLGDEDAEKKLLGSLNG